MIINNPKEYFDKKVRITDSDGNVHTGVFDGVSYDYDDNDAEHQEIVLKMGKAPAVWYCEFVDDNIVKIEVLR